MCARDSPERLYKAYITEVKSTKGYMCARDRPKKRL